MIDIEEIKRKEEQVFEVLKLPIICKKGEKIMRQDDIIYSGQRYYCKADADMSDLAIGFYEILYKDILKDSSLLNGRGHLKNKEFAGDTMNSFNTIKSKYLERQNIAEAMWPEDLKAFKESYHCLANFWLLPLEMGRTLKGELNKASKAKDYMDRFLLLIKKTFESQDKEIDREYFECFGGCWNVFLRKNYLYNAYIKEKNNTEIEEYSKKECQDIIKSMKKVINKRAKEISESDKIKELWEYFNQYGLIKNN